MNKLEKDLRKLAIKAHDGLCGWNHIDMCSWEYEFKGNSHDWSRGAHKQWLEKIQTVFAEKKLSMKQLELSVEVAIVLGSL